MKAAVLRGVRKELTVEDVDIDSPDPYEIIIRTAAAGVCHSDLHFITGDLPAPMPIVLGHESSGIVESVGSAVTYVSPGDPVVTCLSSFCGTCRYCLSGRPNLCSRQGMVRNEGAHPRLSQDGEIVHQLGISSFAEQLLVHENAVVKIDPAMRLDHAALIGCGVLTGLGAVFRTAGVRPGDTVAVVGCGGVGLACVQGASITGALQIIAVDTQPAKLDLAAQLGATDAVNATDANPVEAVKDLSGGGVSHVFEAVGIPSTFEQALSMSCPGGITTVIGLMSPLAEFRLPHGALSLERRVQGCSLGSNRFRFDIPHYVDLALRGRLDLGTMVDGTVTLDGLNDAFAALERGGSARTIVTFEDAVTLGQEDQA